MRALHRPLLRNRFANSSKEPFKLGEGFRSHPVPVSPWYFLVWFIYLFSESLLICRCLGELTAENTQRTRGPPSFESCKSIFDTTIVGCAFVCRISFPDGMCQPPDNRTIRVVMGIYPLATLLFKTSMTATATRPFYGNDAVDNKTFF